MASAVNMQASPKAFEAAPPLIQGVPALRFMPSGLQSIVFHTDKEGGWVAPAAFTSNGTSYRQLD